MLATSELEPLRYPERHALIRDHAALARRIARQLARSVPPWIDVEDLQAAALLGLVEAAQRFSPARGESFVAFATRRVRGAVLDELRRGDILSRRARNAARRVTHAVRHLEHELGRSPEDVEVAAELGVDLPTYRRELAAVVAGGVIELTPALASTVRGEADSEGEAERQQQVSRVRAALARLDLRDQQVLSAYYVDELSYAEIGRRHGVSESRVCQLHGRAIAKLRTLVAADGA